MARRSTRQPVADWSAYMPPGRRRSLLLKRACRRFLSSLASQRVLITLMVLIYLAICLGLILWGGLSLGVLALLPLLLGPPVGYLAYWLVWREFHE
jgi:hypothetical protein